MIETEIDEAALATMSMAELEAVLGEVARLIAEKATAEKAALKSEIAQLAGGRGFELEELFGAPSKRRRAAAVKGRDRVGETSPPSRHD